jgi:hypothetical protein
LKKNARAAFLSALNHHDCGSAQLPDQLDAGISKNELLSLGHALSTDYDHAVGTFSERIDDAIGDRGIVLRYKFRRNVFGFESMIDHSLPGLMEHFAKALGQTQLELLAEKILASFGLSENMDEFDIYVIVAEGHLAKKIDHPARADGVVDGGQDRDSHKNSSLHKMNMNALV